MKTILLFLSVLVGTGSAQNIYLEKPAPGPILFSYERIGMTYVFDVSGAPNGSYTFSFYVGSSLPGYNNVAVTVAGGIATPSSHFVQFTTNQTSPLNEYIRVRQGAVDKYLMNTTWTSIHIYQETGTIIGEIPLPLQRSVPFTSAAQPEHVFTLKNQCPNSRNYTIKVGGYMVSNGIIPAGTEDVPGQKIVTAKAPASYAGQWTMKIGTMPEFTFDPADGVNASTWWVNTEMDCPTCCGEEGGHSGNADIDTDGEVNGNPINPPPPPPPTENPDGTGAPPTGTTGPTPPAGTPAPPYTPAGGPAGPNDETQDIYEEVRRALMDAAHDGIESVRSERKLTDGSEVTDDSGHIEDVEGQVRTATNNARDVRNSMASKINAFSSQALTGFGTNYGTVGSLNFGTVQIGSHQVPIVASTGTGVGSMVAILRAICLYAMTAGFVLVCIKATRSYL